MQTLVIYTRLETRQAQLTKKTKGLKLHQHWQKLTYSSNNHHQPHYYFYYKQGLTGVNFGSALVRQFLLFFKNIQQSDRTSDLYFTQSDRICITLLTRSDRIYNSGSTNHSATEQVN